MSATDRVGIEIDLMGYDEAMSQMKSLEDAMHGLSGRKNYLKIKAEVDELKMNRDALKAHKVKIQADISEADKKIKTLKKRIADLTEQSKLYAKGSPAFNRIIAQIGRLRNELHTLQGQRMNLDAEFRQTTAEINQATSALGRMQAALRNAGAAGKSFGDIFKSVSTRAAHIGQAMQSAGNAITRMSTPLRMVTNGALLGVGYGAMNMATEGLKSGFSRYDTMKKYNLMMRDFEKGNYTAAKSIEALDASVQGLPTGLDEMVNLAQKFTMTTGDMQKGTDLAIATNNAFLASMSTDTQKYQGMMQMSDVLGGKDMNSREWQALANSMMPAIRMMGESLGKSGKELDEYVASVQQGKVSNEEFIKTLRKAGKEGGKIYEMAQLSKDTWQAFTARIGTAFSRMTYGILQNLDQIVNVASGGKFKSLNSFLDDFVITGINDLSDAAQKWIKNNPDKITDFFKDLKAIDWKGLGKGMLEGVGAIFDLIQKGAKLLNGKSLEGIGKMIPFMSAIGSALTITGGMVKGTRHILGGGVAGMVELIRAVGDISEIGAIAWMSKKFKDIGKAGEAAGKAAKGAKGFSKFSSAVGGGAKLGSVFKGFLPAIEAIGGVGAITTEITGIAALDTWLLSKAMNNIIEITGGFNKVFANVKAIKGGKFNADKLRTAVNNLFDMYDIINGETTSQRAVGKTTVTQKKKEGLASMDKGDLKDISDSITSMNSILGEMGAIQTNMKALKGFKGFDEESVAGISTFVEGLGGIYTELSTAFGENIDTEQATEFSGIMTQAKTMFDSISQIGKLIPQMQKSLSLLTSRGGGTGMGYSTLDMLKQSLVGESGFFTTIKEIMQSVNVDMLGGKGGWELGDVTNISDIMASVGEMFGSMQSIITQMGEMQSSLGGMSAPGSGQGGRGTALATLKTQIVGLMKNIGEIYSSIDTNIQGDASAMVDKMTNVVKSINKIKKITNKLSALGEGGLAGTDTSAFTAIANIKKMVTQLGKALNTEMVESLQADVDSFQTAVDDMFTSLNKMCSDIKVEVKVNGKVTGVNELLSEVRQVNSKIAAAVRAIRNSYTRHVYIHIQRHVTQSGSTGFGTGHGGAGSFGEASGAYSTGGKVRPIYRAKGGGSSIFKPRGTDTVPAMLTPGEFVQRKQAVDYFGTRFMQKINNLDIRGAMRELSARAGNMSAVARGNTIYNNVTNNSPTINQNINTNNPNFAFKRSNRFMMALT